MDKCADNNVADAYVDAVKEKVAHASCARVNDHIRQGRDATAPRVRQLRIMSQPR